MLLVAWNIGSGSVSVTAAQMCEVLFRKTTEGTFYHIVWDIRMPRMLAALFWVERWRYPDSCYRLFSKSHCRTLCIGYFIRCKMVVAVVMIVCLGKGIQMSSFAMVLAAFFGSLLAMGFVLLLSMRVHKMSLLVVCGIMIGYICSAITDFLVTFASDSNIVNLHNWSMGSFSGTDWTDVLLFTVLVCITVVAVFYWQNQSAPIRWEKRMRETWG